MSRDARRCAMRRCHQRVVATVFIAHPSTGEPPLHLCDEHEQFVYDVFDGIYDLMTDGEDVAGAGESGSES